MYRKPMQLLLHQLFYQPGTHLQIWKYAEELGIREVTDKVKHALDCLSTVAIRDSRGKLVAYELVEPHGTMGMLYVDLEHRRKGLATVVVTQLSELLLDKHVDRVIQVHDSNAVSIKLHEKCGFKKAEGCDAGFFAFTPWEK